jgi:hypothetical protein
MSLLDVGAAAVDSIPGDIFDRVLSYLPAMEVCTLSCTCRVMQVRSSLWSGVCEHRAVTGVSGLALALQQDQPTQHVAAPSRVDPCMIASSCDVKAGLGHVSPRLAVSGLCSFATSFL